MRDLLKKKRGKTVDVQRSDSNNTIMAQLGLNPPLLNSDKREQERGQRQQDLRQPGLSKGVGAGRASMNHQSFTNSKSSSRRTDYMISARLTQFMFSEPAGQPSPSSPGNRTAVRWVQFCVWNSQRGRAMMFLPVCVFVWLHS